MEYPDEICMACGLKHGQQKDKVSGWWGGECGWCGYEGSVTSPRDFGYPAYKKSFSMGIKYRDKGRT